MRYCRFATVMLLILAVGVNLTTTVSMAQDYSKENRATFEKIFSPRKFPKDRWHFVGLPLSGNVLGTARLNEKDVPLDDRIKLINPDKWFAENVGEAERQDLNKKIIDTYMVGPIDLDQTTSGSRGVSLSFPGLFQVLGLNANIGSTKGVTTKIHIDKAIVRELNYNEFSKAYNQRKLDPSIYEALKQDIIMCFADIQFAGLHINMTVDTGRNAGIDATLTAKVGEVFDNNSALGLKIEKKGHGTFEIAPTETVTVAYLFRPIPKQGREVDPSGYLMLNPSRDARPPANTDERLELELRNEMGTRRATQDLPSEEQAGDPDLPLDPLRLDVATNQRIDGFLESIARGPRWNRPELARETLRIAKTHIGNSRTTTAPIIKRYLELYGLPFRYPDGKLVPFCAAGIGFVSVQAYRSHFRLSADINDPDVPLIFRDSLADVKRDLARTHPSTVTMMNAAIASGTWQGPKNPDGTRVMPKPGWLVFYNWSHGSGPQHVGIVDQAEANQLHTVEFNTSGTNYSNGGAVLARTRDYGFVIGYIDTYKEPKTR